MIRLTRICKETCDVFVDTPSALTMRERFENATPLTACAKVTILSLLMWLRHHDYVDVNNYKERQNPSKRQSLRRKANVSSDIASTRQN